MGLIAGKKTTAGLLSLLRSRNVLRLHIHRPHDRRVSRRRFYSAEICLSSGHEKRPPPPVCEKLRPPIFSLQEGIQPASKVTFLRSSSPAKEMPSAPPMRQRRGPRNELHRAARGGFTERTVALLSSGSIDIDQGDPGGYTPLMLASFDGHLRVARILLNKGANTSIVTDDGGSVLHMSAKGGHLAVSKMLMEAGADLEAKCLTDGVTPLHVAAFEGHSKLVEAMIERQVPISTSARWTERHRCMRRLRKDAWMRSRCFSVRKHTRC